MYNVAYDDGNGNTRHYLAEDCRDHETAKRYMTDFIRRYVGMPYPNGKGFYPFKNVRIVKLEK